MSFDKENVRELFKDWHEDAPHVMTPKLIHTRVIESLDGVPVVIEVSRDVNTSGDSKYGVAVLMACDEDYEPVRDEFNSFTSITVRFDVFSDHTGLHDSRAKAVLHSDDIQDIVENLRFIEEGDA